MPTLFRPSSPADDEEGRNGVTLVELLVALVLSGIVAASVVGFVVASGRTYRRQTAAATVSATLRAATAMLPLDLAGLGAGDSLGSDIVAMRPSGVAFKATRAVSFMCGAPLVRGPRSGSLIVAGRPRYGLREPEPRRDSVFVYAVADPSDPDDDYWLRADLESVRPAGSCPDGSAGEVLEIASVRPPGGLIDVGAGAPVLSYEVVQITAYADRSGAWWLGVRLHGKSRGWGGIQPVIGPLRPRGLRFSYHDVSGSETTVPREVRRIVVVAAARPDGNPPPGLEDSVRIEIGLLNGRRP